MIAAAVVLFALAQGTPPGDEKSEVERLKERVAELEKKAQEGEKKQEPPKPSGGDLRVFWSDGLKIESADKKWKFALGGRAQADAYWIQEDEDTEAAVGDQEDGARVQPGHGRRGSP